MISSRNNNVVDKVGFILSRRGGFTSKTHFAVGIASNPRNPTFTKPAPTRVSMLAKLARNTEPFSLKKQGSLVHVNQLVAPRTAKIKKFGLKMLHISNTTKTRINIIMDVCGEARNNIPRRDSLHGKTHRLDSVLSFINRLKK